MPSDVGQIHTVTPRWSRVASFVRGLVAQPWIVAALATSICLVIVAVRAIGDGVQLTDERTYYETRSRDVLTANHPWLGTRVSAAQTAGEFNHPGPLMFDLFAIPVRLFGGAAGVTLGVVAVHLVALWLAVRAAREAAGAEFALAVAVGAALLCWTLGTDRLIDPWGPHLLVLPFYCLLVLITAVVAGAARWLSVAVAVGSACLQTHVGYVILVPGLLAVGVGALLVRYWRIGGDPPWRPLVLSASVGFVLWLQPLWQQLFGPGPANLSGIVDGARNEGGARAGASVAARLLVRVTAVPPAWIGPSYETNPPEATTVVREGDASADISSLPSLLTTVFVGAAVVAVALWCVRRGRAAGIAATAASFAVAGVAAVLAFISISGLPVDWAGIVAHKYRYLWPLGAFVAVAFLAHVLARARRSPAAPIRQAPKAVAAGVVAVAALTVPVRAPTSLGLTLRDTWPVAEELRAQLADADLPSEVVVRTSGLPFPEYFLQPVIAELGRQGVDFDVDTDAMVTQYGERRRDDGSATTEVVLRHGPDADVAPPGSTRLAYVDGDVDALTVGVYAQQRERPPASD